MYRSSLDARHKSGAIIAVAAIHALLLLMLLHLSGKLDLTDPQSPLRVFDLRDVPPPPPPPPPTQQRASAKPKASEGGSAPPNIKSEATPVVVPPPRIVLPVPEPIAAAKTPANGTASTQGAALVAGPGTGSGGQGNGNGSGNGTGSGSGDGGTVSPPQLITPVLRGRDFSRDLLDQWPRGTPVFLRLRVDAQGNVAECIVDRGSGVGAIDSEICDLVRQKLRFRPALNRSGQAVAGWFGYGQTPPR
jgi:protein TonB